MVATLKQQVQEEARKLEQELWEVALYLHAHPELGLQEFLAVEKLTSVLEAHGFSVERGVAGMDTAFRATYSLNGGDSPNIVFLAEYDALPEVGHACGHNLMGAMGIGAGIALSKLRDAGLKGQVVVIGTPAEEGLGGKIVMVREGVFNDVDAALIVHPGDKHVKRDKNLAAFPVVVEFKGKPAHAASRPHEGINALDAVIELFNNVALLRQQLTPDVRIHGIITHGGVAANIIPEYTRAKFIVRSSELARTYNVLEKFKQCAKAAALATGATETLTIEPETFYEPLMSNQTLMNLFADNMTLLGEEMAEQEPQEFGGSTDMGNVSQAVPAIHPNVSIAEEGQSLVGHSHEFALAAKSEQGKRGMMLAVQSMAMCGVDLFSNPDTLAKVKAEFQQTSTKA